MRRAYLLQTLGIGVAGFAMTLGCNHCARECCCSSRLEPAPVMTMLPAPASKEKAKVVAQPTALTKSEPPAKPAAPTGDIAVTDIAPPATGSHPGTVSGTLVLSAADAQTLGIRPGYTPDALVLPDLPPQLPDLPAEPASTEPAKEQK
jgi:hypothetical protein